MIDAEESREKCQMSGHADNNRLFEEEDLERKRSKRTKWATGMHGYMPDFVH